MLPLLFALACTDPKPTKDAHDSGGADSAAPDDTGSGHTGGDTGDTGEWDTADTSPEDTDPAFPDRGCHDDGAGSGLGAAERLGDLSYRVVRIPGLFEELYAVVFFPADGRTAYDNGAPVVVVAPPGLSVDSALEETPRPYLDARFGVIEIQPVYPGWTVAGHTTKGGLDDGGTVTGSTVSQAMRFATGQVKLDGGYTLSQVTGVAVCDARVGLLGVGSGGFIAMSAIAPDRANGDVLAGVALFEAPSVPQMVTGDLGAVWMDPDPEVDANGDGYPWSDAQNTDWTEGACDVAQCHLDYSSIAWDPDTRLSDVFPDRFSGGDPGVLYLDRSGSGALELGLDATDVDGDGALGADEDFVLIPHEGSDGLRYYTPDAAVAATAALEDWPDGLATLEPVEDFWAPRSVMGEATIVVRDFPNDIPVVVGFTEVDEAVAVPARPQVVLNHDLFAGAGFPTRYNLRADALTCLTDPAERGAWTGGPKRTVTLAEGELDAAAMPEAISAPEAVAALSALWDGLGAFDRCPY